MRIAVAELPGACLDEWEAVRARIEDRVARAAALGAELLVLPECAFPAYVLGTRTAYDAARRAGLPPPEAFIRQLKAAARRYRLAICAGFVEEDGDALWNAAAVVAADGTLCGVRRKAFLWGFDRDYYAPADTITPVDTPLGRVGVLICADMRLPEIPAALVAQGATLLLQPTAWVNAGRPERPWNPQPDFLVAARAREFGVPIASASRAGWENGQEFVGGGLVCDREGQVVASCRGDGAAVACADVAVPSAPRGLRLTAALRASLCDAAAVSPAVDVPPLYVAALEEDTPVARRALRAALPPDAVVLAMVAPLPNEAEAGVGGGLRAEDGGGMWVLKSATKGAEEVDFCISPADGRVIRVVVLPGSDAEQFAPARVAALRGAHLVVFAGGERNMDLLRARACENRVFVAHVSKSIVIMGPVGGVQGEASVWPADGRFVQLPVWAAGEKHVAVGTDVLRDPARRRAAALIGPTPVKPPDMDGSGQEFR